MISTSDILIYSLQDLVRLYKGIVLIRKEIIELYQSIQGYQLFYFYGTCVTIFKVKASNKTD